VNESASKEIEHNSDAIMKCRFTTTTPNGEGNGRKEQAKRKSQRLCSEYGAGRRIGPWWIMG
jgi:hypothetical protein